MKMLQKDQEQESWTGTGNLCKKASAVRENGCVQVERM